MAGCVTKIIERNLVLDIPESTLCKEFGAFDSNDDGVLESSDLLRFDGLMQEGSTAPAMQSFITTVLSHHGIIQPSLEDSYRSFFNLFNRVYEIHSAVIGRADSWQHKHIDTWGREMEFDAAYWKNDVLPLVKDGGLLSNCYGVNLVSGMKGSSSNSNDYGLGHQLSLEMYFTLNNLCGVKKKNYGGGGCSASKMVQEVNVPNLPLIFQGSAQMMMDMYNEVEAFFGRYREVECDADGCPSEDQFALYDSLPFVYPQP